MSPTIALLPDRALIRVEGPDWRPFLHNLLTHDIEGLAVGHIRYCALLTPQGRLLHDLFVFAEETGAILDVAAAGRDALLKRLTLYKLRAKVTIAPADGPVHAMWSPPTEPSPRDAGRGQGEGSLPRPELPASPPVGGAAHPAPLPASAGRGSPWLPDPRLPDLGFRSLAYAGPTTATPDAYDAHRLALGVPDPALDAREIDYPLELNLDLLNAIDFKKGCFIGQETASRMKRRGVVKTRTVPLILSASKDDGPAPPFGTEVLAGDLRAGEIRSGRPGRALALLRLDRAAGAPLTAADRPVRLDPPTWLAAHLGLIS